MTSAVPARRLTITFEHLFQATAAVAFDEFILFGISTEITIVNGL